MGVGMSEDRQSLEYPVQTRSSLSVSGSLLSPCVISIVSSKNFLHLVLLRSPDVVSSPSISEHTAVPSSGAFGFLNLHSGECCCAGLLHQVDLFC